ncbi:helicase-related protein [uncultured Treponema sp.]|uniref:helicase-related protein n=1 Tax=uncultured Treponema sp. TaxID=162155 RepID=UPI002597B121|nr:helicase-related protein [uncultured Treponema sp.]
MDLQNTLIDNSDNLKLVDTLKQLIKNPSITEIKIASGYWDLPGTSLVVEELKEFLNKDGSNLKLLIGKDSQVFANQVKEAKYKDASYPDDFIRVDINELDVKEEYQEAVKLLLDFGVMKNSDGTQKLEIHRFKKNENDESQFLHSKCYIFISDTNAYGIIGSSNFTQKGLEGNAELIYLECDGTRVTAINTLKGKKSHLEWFNEKWELSEDWTQEFLEQILKNKGNKNIPPVHESETSFDTEPELKIVTPYDAYIKTLIDQFGSVIDSDGMIKESDYLPTDPNFKILKYQTEAVNQGFSIMQKHHGFILADVVGLGKTFTAVMVIKRYLLSIGFSKPVLVICPPAIKKSWEESIAYFDKDAKKKIKDYVVISTIGCLDTDDMTDENGNDIGADDFDENFSKRNFGLIVVDESHRFRNNGTQMYQKLDDLIADTNPYVVLLSATPQNNRPNDLANQIYLFEREHTKSTLSGLGKFGNNLEYFFADKEKIYEECIKDYKGKDAEGKKIPKTQAEKAEDLKKLDEITKDLRDYVVNQLVIRRTRTDLKKYYAEDIASQGLVFPEITPPKGIPYEMTGELGALFVQSLDIIAPNISHVDWDENGLQTFDFRDVEKDCLGYFRYRGIEFLKSEEHKNIYQYDSKRNVQGSGTISVEGISARLAAMMELHLVKRLESSRDAFEESLRNFRQNTQNMLDMIKADRVFICPDVDVNKILHPDNRAKKGSFELCLDEIKEKADRQNKKHQTVHNQEFKASDFTDAYKERLQNDLLLTNKLIDGWKNVKQDPKINTFIRKIDTFMDKKKNKHQKLVIFTECIATQNALVSKFKDCASEYKVLSITAKNRKDMQEVIAENFDANYKGIKKSDYNILITTDVLAEGVNLHESNTLLNYDSPWNATTLMQRLGRINRIGSTSEKIYSYNFYPSTKGDEQINLYKRTLVKLQAFHNLFGEDSQIYTTDETVVEHELPQFEMDESESPNMKFIKELKDFSESNPDKFNELKEICEPIYTAVKVEEKKDVNGLVVLHKMLKDNSYLDSLLYKNKDERSETMSQTEFVQLMQNISSLPLEEVTSEEYKKITFNVLNAFNSELMNEGLSLKSKFRAGTKEKTESIKKVQTMFRFLGDNLTDEISDKLDEIRDSVNNSNHGLIRRINETEVDPNLLTIGFESIINEWYSLCFKKNSDKKAENKITFVLK